MPKSASPHPASTVAPGPRTRGRRTVSAEVWTRIRDDYLAGMSGPTCCNRYGVTLAAFRAQASRGRWRRVDQPWVPPNTLDAWDEGVALEERIDGDLDRVEMRQLAYVAARRMMRAVLRGNAAEALRWRRVRQVLEIDQAEVEREVYQFEALANQRREEPLPALAPTAPDVDSVDAVDSVFR